MEKGKVIVGMSGGVDSTAAACLLKGQGYEVIGVTLELWQGAESRKAAQDAARVAEKLGIRHEVLDFSGRFLSCVVENFMESYRNGLTPNPCVLCNPMIKEQALLEKAKAEDAAHIATGHYARIEKSPVTGRYAIRNAASAAKDQTYALYRLSQEQLAAMLLPLGEYTKDDARRIAAEIDGDTAGKSESQDICFIPDGDYAGFILREGAAENRCAEGNFVDLEGNPLGRHKGLLHYTVGQRKGLGIAFGRPMYVHSLRPGQNQVVLCGNEALFRRSLRVGGLAHMAVGRFEAGARFLGKLRYAHKPAWCTVERAEGGILECSFDEPQRAITPGQSLVLYDGEFVAGGGFILPEAEGGWRGTEYI